MRSRLLIGTFLAGVLALVYAFTIYQPPAQAAAPENLQVLPKSMSKKEVKKLMKTWAKALGVKCEHCHNMDDMAEDGPKKEKARQMLRMVNETNGTYLKKYKARVTCMTCHQGSKKPKK